MRPQRNTGFTTLELSLVIIIFGVVMSCFLFAFQQYVRQSDRTQTKHAIATARTALFEFQSRYGRYPCPADPAKSFRDPSAGIEFCGTPRMHLGRDANSDGVPDIVLSGTLPFRTLMDPDNNPGTDDGVITAGLSADLSFDGWDHQLTYAVTRSMTSRATYSDLAGAIEVIDENNHSVLQTPGSAHIALVSHGKNGRGAYTRDGALVNMCEGQLSLPPGQRPLTITEKLRMAMGVAIANLSPSGNSVIISPLMPVDLSLSPAPLTQAPGDIGPLEAPSGLDSAPVSTIPLAGAPLPVGPIPVGTPIATAPTNENENCDEDATFLSGLYSEEERNHNDDFTSYLVTQYFRIWNLAGENKIVNGNPGRVGIGVRAPRQNLHVGGSVSALSVEVEKICDRSGDNCFSPAMLAGRNKNLMSCPQANQAVIGIANNRVICDTAFTGRGEKTCPPGTYMNGISNITGVICIAPPANP